MFDKLMAAQQQAQAIKDKLDTVMVNAEVENGLIKVEMTANKQLKSVNISPDLLAENDKEQLEELLVTVFNKACSKADEVSAQEMQAATQSMLGGLGNMFGGM